MSDATPGERRLPGRRTAEEAARSRQEIVAVALRMFATRGFDAVSLRDIAGEAGASHGLIRHHFGSKQGVWTAVVEEADRRLVAALPPGFGLAPPAAPVGEAVRAVLGPLAVASHAHPEIVQLLVREASAGGPRLAEILTRVAALRVVTADLLGRLHAAGRMAAFDEATFFLLVLTSVVVPFAIEPLTGTVLGADTGGLDPGRHAERLSVMLAGPSSTSPPSPCGAG